MSQKEDYPKVLGRDSHTLSRKKVDEDALKVMYRLIRNGHKAYLVGGGVRDLLLGKEPKDFDIGTDASPETVRKLFRNSRIIGRRFKINHVYFKGNKIIEVTTFRALDETQEVDPDNPEPVKVDNTYGTAESDALRRDLTINGIFYDLETYSIIDYVGGVDDLENKIIRIIGEPSMRIQEDPVRMIRAVRHAARAGFEIEPETHKAICEMSEQIALSSPPRVYEEIIRDFQSGVLNKIYELFFDTGMIEHVLPFTHECFVHQPGALKERFGTTLEEIDKLVAQGWELPTGFVFAALLCGNVMLDEFEISEELEGLDELSIYLDKDIDLSKKKIAASELYDLLKRYSKSSRSLPAAGRRMRRDQLSSLRKAIRRVLLPIRVPRRVLEEVESFIKLRYMLAYAFKEGFVISGDVATSQAMKLGVLMLKVTSHSSLLSDAFDMWAEGMDLSPQIEVPEKRTRPKRKRKFRNKNPKQ